MLLIVDKWKHKNDRTCLDFWHYGYESELKLYFTDTNMNLEYITVGRRKYALCNGFLHVCDVRKGENEYWKCKDFKKGYYVNKCKFLVIEKVEIFLNI